MNGDFSINENSKMCINQIIIRYSWLNINNSLYNNATLQYIFCYYAYNITFPIGFYTPEDLKKSIILYDYSVNCEICKVQYVGETGQHYWD